MSLNYALAKEIYGVPWSVDSVSYLHLSSILKNIQSGVSLEVGPEKCNSICVFDVKNETKIISDQYELNTSENFEGIGVINLNGAITKNGGASSYGTKYLSSMMLKMSLDSRIKGFIMLTDSGGGATGAVKLMQDAINEVKSRMPIYCLIEKGGMAGSAAYGIASACTEIYSEDEMNIVGSAGTMIQFSGIPNGTVDTNGEKHITLYATKSISKNKGFNEAIENDNYSVLIDEMLDPINENFLAGILSNRPILKGTNYDDGNVMFSKDAIGTYIDGIASFSDVVSMILNSSKNSNKINNPNSKTMNKVELKSTHPEVYAEILAEGVSSEANRVATWEVYRGADSEAVTAGIKSGKEITSAEAHAFQVILASNGKITDLKTDSQGPVVTKESNTAINTDADLKAKAIKAAFDFE